MVVSGTKQLPETYQLWRWFKFPMESGSKDAIAVPATFASQLTAAYAIMMTMILGNFWTIVICVIVYFNWHKSTRLRPHPLFPTLWNQKAELFSSITETFKYSRRSWSNREDAKIHKDNIWLIPLLFLVSSVCVGQKFMEILVPPLLTLGAAAPVNPDAIYFPRGYTEGESYQVTATRSILETPWALRALGSVDLGNKELREKVSVSEALSNGVWASDKPIQRVNYAYKVTGVDLGLQRYPTLLLSVTGSCVTEYGWFNGTDRETPDLLIDRYNRFGNASVPVDVSILDGRATVGRFFLGKLALEGTLKDSNATWSAFVSSVQRKSFSSSSDPWYFTDKIATEKTGADYIVKEERPALSCWQDDVWSYNGRISTVVGLNSKMLPGLELSVAMQEALSLNLNAPMIQQIGQSLGPSSLKSATSTIGQIFSAKDSGFQKDLERLVLASYIATTNILTDSTQYPAGAERELENLSRGADGKIKDGVADFIVFSSDVSALSMAVVIAIPVLLIVTWWLSYFLLRCTRFGIVESLNSNHMFQVLTTKHDEADKLIDGKSPTTAWRLD
ncbi:hypothetical protein QQS21_008665 [Conoideocrella luteorostrata]|uniref:Uncharacterized protein n=1 Tax=Conoideocrella luteorostrata TaxID=1105319 RepID=A0AAJ0CL55_9HYPO|nr:hypothetical protein QQS21_008665 [Conoideocrella luteorostrata]